MKIQRFEDARQFYQQVKDYLLQQEAMYNLQLGICNRLINDPDYHPIQSYFATVVNEGEIIGVVMRTPPSPLIVSLMPTTDIMPLIVADVHDYYQSLPGVNGPIVESQAFAYAWCKFTGNEYNSKIATRIYQLEQVKTQIPTQGELRLATIDEREILKTWHEAFLHEALGKVDTPADTWVERQLSQNNAYFWYDKVPVSMACRTRSTPNGIAISMVYTPPEFRRQGYSSNCVAALSQELLNQGYKYCFLFADVDNATSNHIYQQIGYQPVGEWQEYTLS